MLRRCAAAMALLVLAISLVACDGASRSNADGGTAVVVPGVASDGQDPRPVTLRRVADVRVSQGYPTGTFVRAFPRDDGGVLVTFGTGDFSMTPVPSRPGLCAGSNAGWVYRELNADLSPAGAEGRFVTYPDSCASGDAASTMLNGDYYFLTGGMGGWKLTRFGPGWQVEKSVNIPLDKSRMANDQMLAFDGNGVLLASSLYNAGASAGGDQRKTDPTHGEGTFQKLFTSGLEPLGERLVIEPEHINGSSLVFANGEHHLVTSRAFHGDLLALRYDKDWNFLGEKTLAVMGQWSQGVVYADGLFYVAWVDLNQKGSANIRLGVFDAQWNELANVPVTAFSNGRTDGGRPSVMKVDNRLYVTYDVETYSMPGRTENRDWQGWASVFEIQ